MQNKETFTTKLICCSVVWSLNIDTVSGLVRLSYVVVVRSHD